MAMNVGTPGDEDDFNATINTTPLVDIMLVLLIIFLITVPVAIKSAPVELPQVNNIPLQTKRENIVIAVDKEGLVYWNATLITGGRLEMENRVKERVLQAVKDGTPFPEVHIRADRAVKYQYVGGVIYAVQRMGIQKVGFISLPDKGSR